MDTEQYLGRAERRRLDRMIAERLARLRLHLDLDSEAKADTVEARIEEALVDILHLVARHNNSGPDRTVEFLQAVADHAKEIFRREEARVRGE